VTRLIPYLTEADWERLRWQVHAFTWWNEWAQAWGAIGHAAAIDLWINRRDTTFRLPKDR
jgi:hypothetical protein